MAIAELVGLRLRSRLALALGLASALLTLAGTPAVAHAQGFDATPPTKGALYRDGQDGRYLLGGTWLYQSDAGDVGLSQGWWRNLSSTVGWSPVSVPNSWNATDLSNQSMYGSVGWYRRDFTLPSGAFKSYVKRRDQFWIVHFDSVNYRATVWLNGRQLGGNVGAYLPFEFRLSGLHRGVNRLIIRVDDRRGPSDVPPGPSGGWWNYGGILGDVYLRTVQRADISQVQVRPVLGCPHCAAQIQEQVTVQNLTGARQSVKLYGYYGSVRLDFGSATLAPYGTWTPSATAKLRHPKLWAPGHPYLYRATVTLNDSHRHRLAHYTDYSGVRTIKVTSDGRIELNGHLLNLRGVNIHEQAWGSGAALSPAQQARLMGFVQAVGATLVRAHYPLAPEFEELADRNGVLLWSEIPVWRVQSQYLNNSSWSAGARAYLQRDILTNQNHPSIMLWSIGNELSTPVDYAESRYIATTAALAHQLDPTRPVGLAIAGWPGVVCQPAYAPLDVIGFNDYFGWFDAGGGTTDDREALSPFLDSLRSCYPNKAIFVSEFGFEGNRNGPVEERGTYQFQENSIAFHLGVFASKPWLSGAIYFALQDFAARPGWGGGDPWPNPPIVQKGMYDLFGNVKPAWPTLSSIYHATTQIQP